MKVRRGDFGFTLLEAIVALVLLTTAGLALFSWINNGFDSLQRIERSNAIAAAEINALEFMRNINPAARPEGNVRLGEVTLSWRAQPVTEPRTNRGDTGDPGIFTVTLYDTEVLLDSPPAFEQHRLSLRQMGFTRMAPLEEGVQPAPPAPVRR
ncbi:MAG: prepilin-type N-terminal cleavage/methylation domain-containing protein [Burkholderiales bacterium]